MVLNFFATITFIKISYSSCLHYYERGERIKQGRANVISDGGGGRGREQESVAYRDISKRKWSVQRTLHKTNVNTLVHLQSTLSLTRAFDCGCGMKFENSFSHNGRGWSLDIHRGIRIMQSQDLQTCGWTCVVTIFGSLFIIICYMKSGWLLNLAYRSNQNLEIY